jgi:transposase InsO family protein
MADNVPFISTEWKADILSKHRSIVFSTVGAHHQNGVAERAIKTVTSLAWAMLLYITFHWSSHDLQVWYFALEQAVFLYNNVPNQQ